MFMSYVPIPTLSHLVQHTHDLSPQLHTLSPPPSCPILSPLTTTLQILPNTYLKKTQL